VKSGHDASVLSLALWRVEIVDRFHRSARLRAPSGSAQATAVRNTVLSLASGPSPDDRPYLLPPCLSARARRVAGQDLEIIFLVLAGFTIRVVAVAAVDVT